MRIFLFLTTLLLTFSCSNRNNSKGLNNDSLQTVYIDTLHAEIDILNDKVQYIGFIDKFYFSNNYEAYVELYFIKDETNSDEYHKIVGLADSLIYQDDENSRHKFPDNLSSKYFDLRGLSKLKIYDKSNNFICNAEFLRVEYLDQNISSPFIAVYSTEKKIKDDSYYCVSNFNQAFEKEHYTISKDTAFTQKILNKLKDQKPYFGLENNGTHLHFSDNDTVISIINSKKFAYIVLTTKTDFRIIYKSPYFENIMNLIIIPMPNDKFPHILTRNVKPETDEMWDKLLYYDGTKYKVADRQRNE